jgi:hypothetical protein
MPSDSQPTPNDSGQHMLVDGVTPVHHRSGVRALLGMLESASAAAVYPIPMPPLEFTYTVPHGIAATHVPATSHVDASLYAVSDSEPGSGYEAPLTSAPPAPEQPQSPRTVPDPMPQEIAQYTTITIPGSTERRQAIPVHSPANRPQLLSGAMQGALQEAGAEAGQPHQRVGERQSEGQSETLPGNYMNTMPPAADIATQLQRAEHSAVRSAVMPPRDSMGHSLAETARESGAGPPSAPRQSVMSPMDSPLAGTAASGTSAPTPSVSPVTDGSVTPGSIPMVSGTTAPLSTGAWGIASSVATPDAPIAEAQAGMRLSNTELAPSATVASLAVAHIRSAVGSAGSVSPLTRHTAEQIAQLQRTVSELAAQMTAQQAEQQARLQVETISSPSAQPVRSVERAAPHARTPRAFWDRSYLRRLYRSPRR